MPNPIDVYFSKEKSIAAPEKLNPIEIYQAKQSQPPPEPIPEPTQPLYAPQSVEVAPQPVAEPTYQRPFFPKGLGAMPDVRMPEGVARPEDSFVSDMAESGRRGVDSSLDNIGIGLMLSGDVAQLEETQQERIQALEALSLKRQALEPMYEPGYRSLIDPDFYAETFAQQIIPTGSGLIAGAATGPAGPVIGPATSALLYGLSEGGGGYFDTYTKARAEGFSPEESERKARKVFISSGLIGSFSGPLMNKAAKIYKLTGKNKFIPVIGEGIQEGLQQVAVSEHQEMLDVGEGATLEDTIVAAGGGIGASGLTAAGGQIYGTVTDGNTPPRTPDVLPPDTTPPQGSLITPMNLMPEAALQDQGQPLTEAEMAQAVKEDAMRRDMERYAPPISEEAPLPDLTPEQQFAEDQAKVREQFPDMPEIYNNPDTVRRLMEGEEIQLPSEQEADIEIEQEEAEKAPSEMTYEEWLDGADDSGGLITKKGFKSEEEAKAWAESRGFKNARVNYTAPQTSTTGARSDSPVTTTSGSYGVQVVPSGRDAREQTSRGVKSLYEDATRTEQEATPEVTAPVEAEKIAEPVAEPEITPEPTKPTEAPQKPVEAVAEAEAMPDTPKETKKPVGTPIEKVAEPKQAEKEAEPKAETKKPVREDKEFSMTRADINKDRVEQGIDPIEKKPTRKDVDVQAEAKKISEDDVDLLAERVIANPDKIAVSDAEIRALGLRRDNLSRKRDDLIDLSNSEREAGNEEEAARVDKKLEGVLSTLDTIDHGIGSISGKTGGRLRMFGVKSIAEKFRYNSLLQKASSVVKRKLTTKEKDVFKEDSSKIRKKERELEALQKKEDDLDELDTQSIASIGVEEMKSVRKRRGKKAREKEKKEIKEELRKLGYRLSDITNVGALTYEQSVALAKLAKIHIEEGADTLAEVVKRMKVDIPSLEANDIYNSIGKRVKRVLDDERKTATNLLKDLQTEAKLDRQIDDAFNGVIGDESASKNEPVSKPKIEKLKKMLSKLKEHATQNIRDDKTLHSYLSKVNDIENKLDAGTFDKKSDKRKAPRRDIQFVQALLSDLTSQLNNAQVLIDLQNELAANELRGKEKKREFGSPELKKQKQRIKELQAEIATRRNLQETINKLQRQLETGYIARDGKPAKETSATVKKLNKQVAGLRKQVKDRGLNKLPIDSKKAQEKMLSKMRKEIEDLEIGIDTRKPKAKTVSSPEVLAMKKELFLKRRAFRAEQKAFLQDSETDKYQAKQDKKLEDTVNKINNMDFGKKSLKSPVVDRGDVIDAKKEFNVLKTVRRMEDEVTTIKEQLRTNEFPDLPIAKKRAIKDARIQKAERELHEHRTAALNRIRAMKPLSALDIALMPFDLLRTMVLSSDVGAIGRQGGYYINPRHAGKAFKAAKGGIPTVWSEDTAIDLMNAIKNDPDYNEFVNSYGLWFSELDGSLTNQEETITNRLVEMIPGVRNIARGSQRSQVMIPNLLRMSLMKGFKASHPDASPETMKQMASNYNKTTGRGDLGNAEQFAKTLTRIFLAPRWVVSRVQAPYQAVKRGQTKEARAEIIKDGVAFLSSTIGMMMLLSLHDDIEVNWTEPEYGDWLKIKYKNTYYDVLVGLQQPLRLAFQPIILMLDKLGVRALAKDIDLRRSIAQFTFYKGSPAVNVPLTVLTGKNVIGQKQEIGETLVRSLTPLNAQEFYDIMEGSGSMTETALGFTASTFGVGTQHYDRKKTTSKYKKYESKYKTKKYKSKYNSK